MVTISAWLTSNLKRNLRVGINKIFAKMVNLNHFETDLIPIMDGVALP